MMPSCQEARPTIMSAMNVKIVYCVV